MAKTTTKQTVAITPNELERFLQKPSSSFTKKDIIDYIVANNVEMLNFRYVGSDGRLKTLNFVINSMDYLDAILTTGERVDGSSLFSFIEASSSDLYVVPRYNTAFLDPFEMVPTLNILCSFYDNEGEPLKSSPEYILHKAHNEFKKTTGYTFKALGELEYYIYDSKDHNDSFLAEDQRGYHESVPFTKFEHIRTEAMRMIAACGGQIKYGHSEVGNFADDFYYYEQQEIEFLPCEAEFAAEQLHIAKWILRTLCDQYGLSISFAPKITVGKAGSGLHIHMMLEKDGKNMMTTKDKLSDDAKKLIAGILDLSDAVTAFGNTIPISYLRLVPHQEAPTNICWGDRNRSVLVRVPLGWAGKLNMVKDANPQDKTPATKSANSKQTVEIRSGDGSADLCLYIASLIVAAQHGLTMPNALDVAEKLYVNVNIFKEENKALLASLKALPASCYESAERLEQKRKFFEKNGIFPQGLIDSTINQLKSYNDKDLSERLYGNTNAIAELVAKYINIK
ncbi:MAG: glutamine synthetase family protein [Ignavibacteria bacterium]|jgi:glutamine synthetase|nr:glutamine synthetase family protein [Ignavibacteria bacterium]